MVEAEFEFSSLLPPGWSIKAMVQLGKTFLKSPDGKVMQGKLMAIRQMRKESYPKEHVEMMVNSLAADQLKHFSQYCSCQEQGNVSSFCTKILAKGGVKSVDKDQQK